MSVLYNEHLFQKQLSKDLASTQAQESLRVPRSSLQSLSANVHYRDLMAKIHAGREQALAQFELKREIGKGTFGQVYLAKDKRSGDRVAVKIINNIFQHSILARAAIREISILRQLREMMDRGAYPHVIRLLDVEIWASGHEDFSMAIVMEYGKKDLVSVITSCWKPFLETKNFVTILYSLLCSLHFLHSAGVIHRDIKPTNVLLNVQSKVKLCDFGLARTLPKPSDSSSSSSADESDASAPRKMKRNLSPHVVTRSYRPPEVILLHPEYDGKLDIWSSGVTMIELFNSLFTSLEPAYYHPFQGSSCDPLSPSEGDEGDKDQLEAILSICGKLGPEDTDFLWHDSQMKQVRKHSSKIPKIDFRQEYRNASPDLMSLFNNMLEFNPNLRADAAQLLQSSVFDSIREPKMEEAAPWKVEVGIDESGVFNYKKQTASSMGLEDHLLILTEERDEVKRLNINLNSK